MRIVDQYSDCDTKFIRSSQLALVLFSHKALFGAAKNLCDCFGKLEILEHYGDYMKVRVPKQDKTVGSLFGLMEKNKEEFDL